MLKPGRGLKRINYTILCERNRRALAGGPPKAGKLEIVKIKRIPKQRQFKRIEVNGRRELLEILVKTGEKVLEVDIDGEGRQVYITSDKR